MKLSLSRARSLIVAAMLAALIVFTAAPPAPAHQLAQAHPSSCARLDAAPQATAVSTSASTHMATAPADALEQIASVASALSLFGDRYVDLRLQASLEATTDTHARKRLRTATADVLLVDRLLYRRSRPRVSVLTSFSVSALTGSTPHNTCREIYALEQRTDPPLARARYGPALRF